jgi:hypothetical protein
MMAQLLLYGPVLARDHGEERGKKELVEVVMALV